MPTEGEDYQLQFCSTIEVKEGQHETTAIVAGHHSLGRQGEIKVVSWAKSVPNSDG